MVIFPELNGHSSGTKWSFSRSGKWSFFRRAKWSFFRIGGPSGHFPDRPCSFVDHEDMSALQLELELGIGVGVGLGLEIE